MLIRSLFNQQINSPANLPNEYFIMLEKQQKYKDLLHKLLKLNFHNQNLIQSISTIKLTLIDLIDQFIKPQEFIRPQETFIITQIQQALIFAFSNLHQVCTNINKNIDTKISNYQSHIESLIKQYKEKLEQAIHYRKKVDSIKKGSLQTKEEKDKLARNMEKKRTIQKQFQNTECLLIQNFQNFCQQSHEFLKAAPHQIIFQMVEDKVQATSQIIQIVGEQLSVNKKRPRKQSIMSSAISQISDADAISEQLEQVLTNSNVIEIMPQPQNDLILNQDHLITQTAKGQDTIDDQYLSKSKSPRYWKPESITLKKPVFRKFSIEDQLKNKSYFILKLKKLILTQTTGQITKVQKTSELQKAFETIQAPLTHAQKIRHIFLSTRNKLCDPKQKLHKKNQSKAKKTNLNSFHEKSFVLQNQEFINNHSLRSLKIAQIREKRNLRNEETLNCSSDEQKLSYTRPQHQDNPASISSDIQHKILTQGNKKSWQLSNENPTNMNIIALNQFDKDTVFNNKDSLKGKKYPKDINLQISGNLNHHPSYDHLPNYQFGLIHEINKLPIKTKESRFIEANRKKAVENLFSISNQKINQKNLFEKNPFQAKPFNLPTSSNKKPETQLKNLFSVTFYQQMSNQPRKEQTSKTIQTPNLKINEQKTYSLTTQNIKTIPSKNQIDFSIFEKII